MVFEFYISKIHNWGSVKCYGAFKTSLLGMVLKNVEVRNEIFLGAEIHNKGFEFCTIKGQGQNLTQP